MVVRIFQYLSDKEVAMSRAFVVLGALVFCMAAASVAFAEEGEGEKKEELGFRERMTLQALTGMLELNTEQQAKIKDTLIKMTKSTDEEIKKILSPDQIKKYDEFKDMGNRGMRFGGGAGGPGGMGGMGGMGGRGRGGFGFDMNFSRTLEEWKKRLNLDEKQAKKIEEIIQGMTEEAMSKFMEKLPNAFGGEGRFDWQKAMKELKPDVDKLIDKAVEKIRKELREDQLPEFEKVVAEFKEQVDGWLSGRRPERGDRGDRGRGEFGAWRLDAVMRDLNLPAEEAEILKPKIEEILKLQGQVQTDFQKASGELRELIGKAAAAADVKAKLDGIRAKKEEGEKAIKARQAELRELLTYEQEAKLVMHRVLE